MSQGHNREGTQRQQVKVWEQSFYAFFYQPCSNLNSFCILGSPRASFQKRLLILKEWINKKTLWPEFLPSFCRQQRRSLWWPLAPANLFSIKEHLHRATATADGLRQGQATGSSREQMLDMRAVSPVPGDSYVKGSIMPFLQCPDINLSLMYSEGLHSQWVKARAQHLHC